MNNSNDVLSLELQKNDIGEETTLALRSTFMPFFDQANELARKAKAIVVTSENQTDKMAEARELRLAAKIIRVTVEKKRKSLKEGIVLEGKAIDGLANLVKFLTVPVEKYLHEQENFVKILEEKRKIEFSEYRAKELREFNMSEADILCYNLGEMSQEGYQQLRASWKMTFENKLKLEREEEEKRVAVKKAELQERARIAMENEKLRAEAESTRKKQQDKLAKERAKLKAEREERERLESEIEEAKQEKIKIEEAKAKTKAKAQQAPDKEKLWNFATTLTETMCSDLESEIANSILKQAHIDIDKVVSYIRGQCIDNL